MRWSDEERGAAVGLAGGMVLGLALAACPGCAAVDGRATAGLEVAVPVETSWVAGPVAAPVVTARFGVEVGWGHAGARGAAAATH